MKNFLLFVLSSLIVICTIIMLPLVACANNIDSGSILSEQNQQDIPQPPASLKDDDIEVRKELASDSNIVIAVKQFEFQGYEELITLAELEKISAPYINQELALSQLQAITHVITKYLREKKGHLLSRAYVPEQDITNGIVRVGILVARLDGDVSVMLQDKHRINHTFLQKIAAQSLRSDEAIMLKDLERAVLLVNDIPGISARAYLDKGELPGTSRISLQAKEGRWASALLSVDTFGNRYTGQFRRMGRVTLSDSCTFGDLLSFTYVNADGLHQGKVDFSMPLGYYGTFFNATYSGLSYELKGKLKDLRAKGQAHTFSAYVRHPLVRTKKSSVWVGTGYKHFKLEDKVADAVTSDRDVSVPDVHVSGNYYDTVFGGGLTSFNVALYPGYVDMTDGKTSDAVGAKTDGSFFKYGYNAARLQSISKQVSLFMSARGQFAEGNLDSSQKIILGGPTGVRAYPVGEASGDEGHVFTVENRVDIPFMPERMKTQVVGFFDAGFIRLHKNTWSNSVTNISGRNHYWLTGAGVGLNFEKSGRYRVQCSYAHKIGKNAGRDIYGENADNRSDDGRFWLQATVWF